MSLLISSLAMSTDTVSFNYNGTIENESFQLRSQKTHIEYDTRMERTWCYQQVCRRVQDCRRVCRGNRCQRSCRGTRRVCRTQQRRCTRQVQVPREVFDYDVEANVNFTFLGRDSVGANEAFTLSLDGEKFGLNVSSSGKFLLVVNSEQKSERFVGNTKFIDINYNLEVVNAKQFFKLSQSGITGVSLNGNNFEFTNANVRGIEHHVKLLKDKRVGSDVLLYEGVISQGDLRSTVNSAGNSENSLNVSKYIQTIPSRLRIVVTARPKLSGANVLNEDVLNSMSATANWLFKR